MSFYFRKQGFDGFAHWMKEQSREETEHACMFARLSDQTRRAESDADESRRSTAKLDSPLDAFRHVYGHECEVSEMIDRLMQTAIEEKDNATQEFLWHFVREQVEEEATGRIYRREDSDVGDAGVLFLDAKLGER